MLNFPIKIKDGSLTRKKTWNYNIMFKVNNKDSRTKSMTFLLTLNIFYFYSSVSIVNFEKINVWWVGKEISLHVPVLLPRLFVLINQKWRWLQYFHDKFLSKRTVLVFRLRMQWRLMSATVILFNRARSHETRNELKPVWDFTLG